MTKSQTVQKHSRRTEIVIAIIGLVGIFVTAFLSNWDKIVYKQNIVQATYSGYRLTGNYETELRYFFEVSGARATAEFLQQQLVQNARISRLSKNPEDAEQINKLFDAITKEAVTYEDVFRELLPVYQKHLSLNEIQELNKLYSTDIMQDMVKKMPLLTQDAAPIIMRLMNDYFERVGERVNGERKSQ